MLVASSQSCRRQIITALLAEIVARAAVNEEHFNKVYHSSDGRRGRIRCRGSRYPFSPCRRTVQEVYQIIGGVYFCREYRMDYQSFLRLHDKLQPGILASLRKLLKYELNGLHSETNKPPPIPNGPISTKV